MFHNAVHRKALSMFLVFCMAMNLSQLAGISVFAKTAGGIISAFHKLPSAVSSQTVALGTSKSGLNLPDTLTAAVRLESEPVSEPGENQNESSSTVSSGAASDTETGQQNTESESTVSSESPAASPAVQPGAASDTEAGQQNTEPESTVSSESPAASPANAGDTQPNSAKAAASQTVTKEIQVTWVSSPDYDGSTAGKYRFTPTLPDGYSLEDGVKPPEITVTVAEAGMITAFQNLADSVRWQRTASPDLPTSVKGTVGGKSADIPVTWQADHDFNSLLPETGLYVFTAQPDGYSIADGVEPPRIAVYVPKLPGLMTLLLRSAAAKATDLSIETAEQLSELAVLVNGGKLESFITGSSSGTVSVELENDIDLSGYGEDDNGGKGWVPIGSNKDPFKGTFDGGGHTVTGLYIDDSSLCCTGLFGAVSGTVENLNLSDVDITGDYVVSGVIGCLNGGTAKSIATSGTVNGSDLYVGGIVGEADSGSTVQNCYSTGTISGSTEVGGVAGEVNGGMLRNCYSTGSVSGSGNYIGGVVGYIIGTVQNCAALNSSVSGSGNVGRVVGCNASLSGNYAWSGMKVKGASISSSYADTNGTDANASEIQSESFWTGTLGFDSSVWTIADNKLPILKSISGEQDNNIPVYILTSGSQPFLGKGTSGDPYQISSAGQLVKLAALVNDENTTYNNAYYKLTCDLDLSAYGKNYNGGKGWVPIANDNHLFSGTFDGGGYTVSGLYLNDSSLCYAGLFGAVSGTVENLNLSDVDITGDYGVGGVIGYLGDGTVECVAVSGTVSGSDRYVGGVVGGADLSSTVQNCYSTGTVASSGCEVGGIVGGADLSSTVQNCYSTGTVASSGREVGGIVGYADSTVVQNCAVLNSSLTGKSSVGRVIGLYSLISGTYTGNYAWSGVTGGGSDKTADGLDGADASTTDIQSGSAFWTGTLGFDSSVWTIEENKLPVLKNVPGEQDGSIPLYILATSSQPFLGSGTSTDPYRISSAGQLAELAALVNAGNTTYNSADYKLTCNLDLCAYGKDYNGGKGWVPIGKYVDGSKNDIPFKGTFDGGGHTVSGLYINNSDHSTSTSGLKGAGLFGCIDGGTVKDCRFAGAVSGRVYVGSAVGYMENKSTVENCSCACTVNGLSDVGGVAGYVASGTLQNCCSTGTVKVSGTGGGGVAGIMTGTMENCYSTCTVYGLSYVGGVAGGASGNSGLMRHCYFAGTVSSGAYNDTGGVVGMMSGTLQNCAALNPSITDSDKSSIGRVIGCNFKRRGTSSCNYAWSDMTVNGKSVSSANASSTDGADASALNIQSASFWTDTLGFDSSVWTIEENKLPVLKNVPGTQSGAPGLYLMPKNITYSSLTSTSFTYNGALQKPKVKFGDTALTEDKDYSAQITSTDGSGTSAGINAGTVTLTLTGIGSYTGTKAATYTIHPASIATATVALDQTSYAYDGILHTPAVTVSVGDVTLKQGTNYTTAVASMDGSGTSAGINAGTVTLTLTGTGNYTGKTTAAYTISPASISNVKISDTPLAYTGAELTPEVTYNGVMLEKGKDYSAQITSADGSFTSAGINAGTVTLTLTGKGNYTGKTTAAYPISPASISNVKISDTPLTYTGAELTPEVTYNGIMLEKGKDYSTQITSADGSGTSAGINAGTVTLALIGKGNYTGTKTAAYPISKAPLTITNATAANKTCDGTVAATVGNVILSGFINHETLTLNQDYTVSGKFSDAQIGTDKQVLVSVTMLNTAKANHYAVPGVYVCRANIDSGSSSHDDTATETVLPTSLTDAATGVEADVSGAMFPLSVNGITLSVTRPKISGTSADPQGAAAYQLAVSNTALNIVGSPSLYNLKLLNQSGNTISSFTGSVTVKLPVPAGIYGTPRIFRCESGGSFTDMNAKEENGYLIFSTTHFSYYIIAGTGDSITLDTKNYEMPVNGEYQIGVKMTGKKNVSVKVHSTNDKIASATRLSNGNVQVSGKNPGTTWIMFDVYDDKSRLLAHVSARINVKTGIYPKGDSIRQTVAYTVRDTEDSLILDTKSYVLPIGGKYQIGAWLTGGKAVTVRYYSANDRIASVTQLSNGNYQVTGNGKGTTWIMFDVYDSKNKFLTHASTRIDVKNGVQPKGNSAKQIGIF